MRRNLLAILTVLLIALSMLFAACDNVTPPAETDPETQGTTSPVESDPETEPGTEAPPAVKHDIITDGKVNYALIRAENMSETLQQRVSKLYNYLVSCGDGEVVLETDNNIEYIQTGTHDKDSYEIVIGNTNYEECAEIRKEIGYGDYAIKTVGNKIFIVAWSDKALADAIENFHFFLKTVYDTETKSAVLEGEMVDKVYVVDAAMNIIPKYDGVENFTVHDCGNNCNMLVVENSESKDFDAYVDKLKNEGYTEYDANRFSLVRHFTFTKDESIVNLLHTPSTKETRVIFETTEHSFLHPVEDDYTKVCDSLLIQIGVIPDVPHDVQNGMCYMIRLEDGSFIVMDGGFANTAYTDISVPRNNAKRIYETILEYTPEGQKPRIKAWFITHLHIDHIGAYISFCELYDESVIDLEYFMINNPTMEQIKLSGTKTSYATDSSRLTAESFPNAKYLKIHPGQKLQLANVEVDVLFTHELIAPKDITSTNTSSLVCKFHIGDQTFLMTGDMSTVANSVILSAYGKYLKCDFLQVSHHGYTGGSTMFYRLVDPTWVLWPVGSNSEAKLEKYLSYNEFLHKSENVQQIFYSHWNTTVFTMPYNGTNHVTYPNK